MFCKDAGLIEQAKNVTFRINLPATGLTTQFQPSMYAEQTNHPIH